MVGLRELLFRSRGSLGYPLCFALSGRRDGVENCLDTERQRSIAVRRDILDDRIYQDVLAAWGLSGCWRSHF
jgi:hypothetical protein